MTLLAFLRNARSLLLEVPGVDRGIRSDVFGDGISASCVHQLDIPDCYFLSALASQANTAEGKKTIKNMIKQNDRESYTVTFKGDVQHPVSVSQSDVRAAGVHSGSQWAAIVETAYLKYSHLKERGVWRAKASGVGSAIRLLTGKEAVTDQNALIDCDNKHFSFGRTPEERIRQDLSLAIKRGDVVTARTSSYIPGLTQDHGSLPRNHVFSVLGYEAKFDTVTVRNPWGQSGDGRLWRRGDKHDGITYRGDGVMTMSFDTFRKRFTGMYVAG